MADPLTGKSRAKVAARWFASYTVCRTRRVNPRPYETLLVDFGRLADTIAAMEEEQAEVEAKLRQVQTDNLALRRRLGASETNAQQMRDELARYKMSREHLAYMQAKYEDVAQLFAIPTPKPAVQWTLIEKTTTITGREGGPGERVITTREVAS